MCLNYILCLAKYNVRDKGKVQRWWTTQVTETSLTVIRM
jgi:hypothetical protein